MSRTATWSLSLLAGAITLLVLSLHMSFVNVDYILLLAVALYHGFYGLNTILTEYWPSRRSGSWISGGCIAVSGSLFMAAVYTTLVF